MGLDMYLLKRDKLGKYSECDIAYWSKANQIRKWFVVNTVYPKDGNGELYKVTREQLESLVSDCLKVMENRNLAKVLMPPSTGFFFGDTNIDEFYFNTIRCTIKMVTEVIEETDWDDEDIFYYESW